MTKFKSKKRVKDSLKSITGRLVKLSRATGDKAAAEVLATCASMLVRLLILGK